MAGNLVQSLTTSGTQLTPWRLPKQRDQDFGENLVTAEGMEVGEETVSGKTGDLLKPIKIFEFISFIHVCVVISVLSKFRSYRITGTDRRRGLHPEVIACE